MVKQLIEERFNGNSKLVWWMMGLIAAVILASLTGFTTWASCGITAAYRLDENFPKVCERVDKIEERNVRRDSDWNQLDEKLEQQNRILMSIAEATNARIPAKDLIK